MNTATTTLASAAPAHSAAGAALRAVLAYASLASLWLLFSDNAVFWVFSDPGEVELVSAAKGWVFVAVTSALLYGLLRAWQPSEEASSRLRKLTGLAPKRTWLPLLYVLLALIVPLVGTVFVRIQTPQIETEAYGNLQAIARLRADQVENWLNERYGNGRAVAASSGLSDRIPKFIRTGMGQDALRNYFRVLIENYDYYSVLLTDTQGQILLTQGGKVDSSTEVHELVALAVRTRQVQRSPLYRAGDGPILLDWIVPIVVADSQGEYAVAAIILRDLADQFLYPLVLTWPTASGSAETLLVRSQGDSVVSLNELRHRADTALKLAWPSADLGQVAVLAAASFLPGTVQGKDYRGMEVLAAYRQIANTDWHMVAKIDRDEIFAPMWRTLYWVGFISSGAVAAIMLALFFSWRQHQQTQAMELLAERGRTDRLFAAIADNSTDAIFIKDLHRRYLLVNRETARVIGLDIGQILGSDDSTFFSSDQVADIEATDRRVLDECETLAYEQTLTTTNGDRIYQATKGPMRDDVGEIIGLFGIFRDVTESKQIERDLRVAATTFDAQEGIVVTDGQANILRTNRAFTEITGYTAEEVAGKNPGIRRSGRHDKAFYEAMWDAITRKGSWQGEIWNRRKAGDIYPEWLSITAVRSEDGVVTNYVGSFTDISERKTAENEINLLAFYDPLTGLPNRRLLLDRLQQVTAGMSRSERHGALLFIDLDNFKTLNDTLGHDVGDQLLQQVAARLVACVREGDTVSRQGGDEFVVMLEDLSESPMEAATQTEAVGEKILATLNQTYVLAGAEHHSTPSIGITLFAGQQGNIDELMKRADLAMYQAKAAGRNALRFFDPEMQAVVSARVSLEAELREALVKEQFVLYYQAQVIGQGRLTGAEALLRWRHPARGIVGPGEFIPLAEETGLILPLGTWVLKSACAQLAAWASRPEMEHLSVAVNVSARQFRQADFVSQVLAILEQSGANPLRLKLELTESLLVDNVEDIISKMSALKARGVAFSLDDFGTGYSSLAYLKRLPLDHLKIDQSFVRDVLIDPNDAAIAKTVVALAESLGLAVIAEGVEMEAQRDFLARHGCHAYQGYLFSRPLPLESFERYREQSRSVACE